MEFYNPNGVAYESPGLRVVALLWGNVKRNIQPPTGLHSVRFYNLLGNPVGVYVPMLNKNAPSTPSIPSTPSAPISIFENAAADVFAENGIVRNGGGGDGVEIRQDGSDAAGGRVFGIAGFYFRKQRLGEGA